MTGEGYEDDGTSMVALDDGTVLNGIHSEDKCRGSVCWTHKPTDHPYREWPTAWEGDVSMLMRVCEHGQKHFDPDCMTRLAEIVSDSSEEYAAMIFVHDCDGCGPCYSLDLPEIIVTDSKGTGLDSDTWDEYQEHMQEHHGDDEDDDEYPWGEHEHDENCAAMLSVAYSSSSETVAFTLEKPDGNSTTGLVPVQNVPLIISALQDAYQEWSRRGE